MYRFLRSPRHHDASRAAVAEKPGLASVAVAAPGPVLIRLSGVSKDYRTAAGPFRALRSVDLDIRQGEFVAIIGSSGAGKTTLVNMITGVDHPTTGSVCVDDVEIHALSETQLSQWRGTHLGVVFQAFHLIPGLSLLDNVLLPADFTGTYRPRATRERALQLLRDVELAEHAHKYPSEISGGQQQRVAIARALINDPPLVVADEPTGRLDSVSAEAIFLTFRELVEQGKTIVMVTHDQGLARRVSRTLQITDGEVSQHGL
jgi:putative ABC transport system ATP-binding protein